MLPFGSAAPVGDKVEERPAARISRSVFGIPGRPAGGIGLDQVLGVIAQRLADFEDGPKFIAPGAGDPRALVVRPARSG